VGAILDEPGLTRVAHYADHEDDLDLRWLRAVEERTGATPGGRP